MHIDYPTQYANACKTSKSAAVAAAAIETEISLGEREEDWYAQAEDALALLRERHPGFWNLDAYMMPPSLSPAARHALQEDPSAAIQVPEPTGERRRARPRSTRLQFSWAGAAVAAMLTVCVVSLAVHMLSVSSPAKAAVVHAQAIPGWTSFHELCTQASSPTGCRCWEQHLEAQGISANDALLILNQAQASTTDPSYISENLQGQPAGWAMKGCSL